MKEKLIKVGSGRPLCWPVNCGVQEGAKPQVSFLGQKAKVPGIRSTLSLLHPRPWHTVLSSPVSVCVPTQLCRGRHYLGVRWGPEIWGNVGAGFYCLTGLTPLSLPVGFRIRMKLPLSAWICLMDKSGCSPAAQDWVNGWQDPVGQECDFMPIFLS